jgi:hypothetical protein
MEWLPGRDHLMILMPILPLMLIGSILVAQALDRRGFLGNPLSRVSIRVPLTAIAGAVSLAAAALHFAAVARHLASAPHVAWLFLVVAAFQGVWAGVYPLRPSERLAWIGVIGSGVATALWFVAHTDIAMTDLFATSFQIALVLVLLPQIAPSVADRLAAREMKAQRAFVLACFSVVTLALFTSMALVA